MNRERIKALIELSSTIEDADKVLSDNVGLNTLNEKLTFLKGMFNEVEIVAKNDTVTDELLYVLWLHAIIDGHCGENNL